MTNGAHLRSHIFSGLLLILIGGIFLLNRFYPELAIGHLFRLYWPLLLIVWGVAKLIDYFLAQRSGEGRPPILSGGEAALLILIAFVVSGFIFHDWLRERYPDYDFDIPAFHQTYTQSRDLPVQTIPAGSHIAITTGRGAVIVTAVEGNTLRVHAMTSVWGPTESSAQDRMRETDVVVNQTANGYEIHPLRQDRFRSLVGVDLNVEVPKSSSVTASSGHGDIRLSGVGGDSEVRAYWGNVDIQDAGADVSITMQRGTVHAARIAGNLHISGRGGDIDISDVSGDAITDGPFIGTLRVHNVAKTVHCTAPWAELSTAKLTGRIEADAGDMSLSNFAGPTRITAHNKDIDLQNAAGRLDVSDVHGDINVSYLTPPHEELNITNDSGDVNLTLPADSNFEINAISRSGDVESDFLGATAKSRDIEETGRISGKVGTLGPKINIATSYGTIHLRKAK